MVDDDVREWTEDRCVWMRYALMNEESRDSIARLWEPLWAESISGWLAEMYKSSRWAISWAMSP